MADYTLLLAELVEAVQQINTNYDGQKLLDALKLVDGDGSGLDADMLDGKHAGEMLLNDGSQIAKVNGVNFPSQGTDYPARAIMPDGAEFMSMINNLQGAIKIALPNYSNAMISFSVRLYNYITDESCVFFIAGYTYKNSNRWFNPSVTHITNGNEIPVRFVFDDGKFCVYLGNDTSVWNYPVVSISDVHVGFEGRIYDWSHGWTIELVPSISGNVWFNYPDARISSSAQNNAIAKYIEGASLPATGENGEIVAWFDGTDKWRLAVWFDNINNWKVVTLV